MLKFYNSLTRQIEEFKPINSDSVGFYNCGPTVYHYAHIGNLRTMILADLIRRSLEHNGYKVNHVMNITDVGHLTADSDTGEDKMEKGAKTADDVYAVAKKYTDAFLQDLFFLNILPPHQLPKATDHIEDQIEIIKTLILKGIAYESEQAVYFDVAKYPNYNQLTGQNLSDMLLGARQEVVTDPEKKNPADFVLWFKAVGRYQNHILRWPSPWGEGFPGWHIECSAMNKKYLGQPFDIHSGGVDLKFPHHTNEIAQSEAAFEAPLAKFWIHGEHLQIDKNKMGKSEGNITILSDIIKNNINPLSFRYLTLTTHYRSQLNFSWDNLTASQNALNNLYEEVSGMEASGEILTGFQQAFDDAVNDDLDMPKAIAIMWDMVKSSNPSAAKLATLLKFDRVLGLNLNQIWLDAQNIPTEVKNLLEQRITARLNSDYASSDQLRKQIEDMGYIIDDTKTGQKIKKKF